MESRIEGLERELRATQEKLAAAKDQLRLQNRRARQLVAACTSRAQEKEREMHMLRVLKDGQLQSIVRKLLHFESLLRQEQKKIVDIVHQKDAFIAQQARELDLLRQSNRKLLMAASNDDAADADVPDKSKLAKLNSGAAKNHRAEDKENSGYRGNPEETPLVTKMVRRFELPAGGKTKPEVPKKPTRLSNQWKAEAEASVHRCDSGSDTGSGSRKGVTRADSVNDHGYFTLEKRKHPEIRKADESPSLPHAADEMDLRHNFEEFHLDSLEEEEHFYELGKEGREMLHADASMLMETPPLSLTESPIRSPGTSDRSSGDGAEWTQSYDPPSTPPATTILSAGDCTSLSVSGSMLLPQLGDATPTAVQFDRFLDVSGLTQKSILTPSRLLSNHKNMLKPKDVKLRSKVKAGSAAPTGSFNCRLNDVQHTTSQVRYYVEPFL